MSDCSEALRRLSLTDDADPVAALEASCKLSLDAENRARMVRNRGAELAASQLTAAVASFTSATSPPDADSTEHRRASLALRLCRNLCAGQPAAREALKRAAAPAAVNSLVRQIARQQPPPVSLLSIAMQMLCNLCVEDSEACEMVWSLLHPETCRSVAMLRGDGAGLALVPLSLLLRASCQRSPACRRSLFSPEAANGLLGPLLDWTAEEPPSDAEESHDAAAAAAAVHSRGEAARWLALLASDLCGCPGDLSACLASLAPPGGEEAPPPGIAVRQGVLLHLLAEGIEERAHAEDAAEFGDLIGAPDVAAVCSLVTRAAAAAAAVAAPAAGAPPPEENDASPDPAVGTVLAGGLRVLQTAALVAGEKTAAAMVSSGVLKSAVRLLERMGPPTGPRGGRPAPAGPGPWVEEEFNGGAGVGNPAGAPASTSDAAAAEQAQEAGSSISKELYFGLRRDLVAVVGNLCHGRPAAVGALMAAEGIPAVLQQCRGDEGDSFLREWAIWAVRNICEASEAARDSIRELQPVGVERRGDDLARMGLDVEWDAELNRPVLRSNRPPPPGAPAVGAAGGGCGVGGGGGRGSGGAGGIAGGGGGGGGHN